MQNIRLRFAPSPTGPLHIGGLRTALYNYLIAKNKKGKFILRIEDTDQSRFNKNAESHINESLKWCNIIPDESPENPGKYGPYRQSERADIYKKYVDKLIDTGHAYYAFDDKEELESHRKKSEKEGKTFIYNWENRHDFKNSIHLGSDEKEKLIQQNNYVIRFKSYFKEKKEDFIIINDEIRGKIKVDLKLLDDKIIFKKDGMPTYHLANVVDDHLMKISHVIRGEEWLPSLALHFLLYDSFKWEKPLFAHLPLILKPSGKGKLSKRDGEKFGVPVYPIKWEENKNLKYIGFKEIGFEKEAFINFICMIGWNPGSTEEVFNTNELIDIFNIDRIIKSGAKYDFDKAKWFNSEHIKKIDSNILISENKHDILKIFRDEIDEKRIPEIINLVRERVGFKKNILEESKRILKYDQNQFKENIKKLKFSKKECQIISHFSETIVEKNKEDIKELFFKSLKESEIKIGDGMKRLRLCLTGNLHGADLFTIIKILNIEALKERISISLNTINDQNRNN